MPNNLEGKMSYYYTFRPIWSSQNVWMDRVREGQDVGADWSYVLRDEETAHCSAL